MWTRSAFAAAAVLLITACAAPIDGRDPGGEPVGPGSAAPASSPSPATSAPKATSTPKESAASPPVKIAEELRFTAETIKGEKFAGESLAGKPAVLWFWAPWCPVCQREAPTVAGIVRDNPKVTFVGVAAQDQLPAMVDFVSEYELGSFTHLADLEAELWTRFGVTYQPAYAFIGSDGSVEVVKQSLPEEDLAGRVAELG